MTEVEKALGVDPCNREGYNRTLDNLYDSLGEEIVDTVQEIAFKFMGPFMLTFLTLFTQLFGAATLNFTAMTASAVLGGSIGSLMSLVNLTLSLMNGSRIMLKYLAAKTLRNLLRARLNFNRALSKDIDSLLTLLRVLDNLEQKSEQVFYDDILKAHPHVARAALIVVGEIAKIAHDSDEAFIFTKPKGSIDNNRLSTAIMEIDVAIKYLTGGNADPLFGERVTKLNEKYGIKVDTGTVGIEFDIPNPLGVANFFKDAVTQLNERGDEDIVRKYIVEFLSDEELSRFLRDYSSTLFLQERIDSIGRRLPIDTYLATGYGRRGARKLLNIVGVNSIKGKIESAFEYAGISTNNYKNSYEDIKHESFSEVSEEVNLAETSVLLQDSWMDILVSNSNVLKVFLDPARDKLMDVEREMGKAIKDKEGKTSFVNLEKSKLKWMTELEKSKTLIHSSTDPNIGFGASSIRMSGTEIQKRFSDSEKIYTELTSQIRSRVFTEDGKSKILQSDIIRRVANTQLSFLFLGPISTFNNNTRKNVIAGLQAIKLALRVINEEDSKEEGIANRYVESVNSNPIFHSVILPPWETFMESLKNVPLLKGVVKSMENGNLSKLVNVVTTAKYNIDPLSDISDCMPKRLAEDSRLSDQAESMASTYLPQDTILSMSDEMQNTTNVLKSKLMKLQSLSDVGDVA